MTTTTMVRHTHRLVAKRGQITKAINSKSAGIIKYDTKHRIGVIYNDIMVIATDIKVKYSSAILLNLSFKPSRHILLVLYRSIATKSAGKNSETLRRNQGFCWL